MGFGVDGIPDGLGWFGADGFAALTAVELGESVPQGLHVFADLGHGADGGTGGADGVALFDGDGRGDVLDAVDGRLVHAVEELAGVRGEGLDVATLAFGVEGVEGEGTLAGTAEAGDDDEAAEGEIEVEVLEVVLADPAQPDAGR